jgi:hypothetical protein
VQRDRHSGVARFRRVVGLLRFVIPLLIVAIFLRALGAI